MYNIYIYIYYVLSVGMCLYIRNSLIILLGVSSPNLGIPFSESH